MYGYGYLRGFVGKLHGCTGLYVDERSENYGVFQGPLFFEKNAKTGVQNAFEVEFPKLISFILATPKGIRIKKNALHRSWQTLFPVRGHAQMLTPSHI